MDRAISFFLFVAEPFGFGPISSSIAIARQLGKLSLSTKCLFIGCGTSYQLAERSGVFDTIYYTEELSPDFLLSFNSGVTIENCLVVANTYPKGVTVAKQANFRCVFIDTLFWMWSALPIALADVEKYYIEDFCCTEIDVGRFGYSPKFKVVPPLIDLGVEPIEHEDSFLLVSLGGIDSNLYDFPVFYEKLIEYISKDPKLKHIDVLICGGGKRFQANDFRSYEHERLRIACLSPYEYISHLKSAEWVIASAGLHSFYENYFLHKNVMFLPPQSYSQYLQLKYIAANFPKVQCTNFEQLGMSHILRENMPDEERICEVKRTNKQLVEKDVFDRFLNQFEKFYSGLLKTDWTGKKHLSAEDRDGPGTLTKDILSHVLK